MLVIRDLLAGTRRFSELRASLAGISPKTLTDRLRSLEEHGLVERASYAEIPPRVEYRLTPAVRGTLAPARDISLYLYKSRVICWRNARVRRSRRSGPAAHP